MCESSRTRSMSFLFPRTYPRRVRGIGNQYRRVRFFLLFNNINSSSSNMHRSSGSSFLSTLLIPCNPSPSWKLFYTRCTTRPGLLPYTSLSALYTRHPRTPTPRSGFARESGPWLILDRLVSLCRLRRGSSDKRNKNESGSLHFRVLAASLRHESTELTELRSWAG